MPGHDEPIKSAIVGVEDPETAALQEQQAMQAVQAVGNSPQAFARSIAQDIAIWKQVAEQAKVELQ
jgi:ABC-type transport system involved in cytochrome bd biosynthesis fused ATPase/permease subunit